MSKKTSKSPEELLQEVLVPVEEQPYKVPENWVWIKMGSLVQVVRGVSYKKNEEEFESTDENCLVVRGGNVQEGKVVNQKDNIYVELSLVKEQQLLRKGDVVIVSSTGSSKIIGKPAIVKENPSENISFGAFLTTLRPSNKLNSDFFGQYFLSSMYRHTIASEAKGSNINNIKQDHLVNLKFPLPPLNEQKRIADKVERLLDKINQAKQLIEEAKETFELRRSAILNKAFRGELTNQWRLQHPNYNSIDWLNEVGVSQPPLINNEPYLLPEGWSWVKFSDVSTIMSNLVDPSNYQEYPHIAPDNMEKYSGRLLDYVTIGEARVTSPKHLFKEGQILYSKIRPYLSKLVVAPFDGLCSADMYPITTKLDTEYLFWLMLSSYFLEKASTAGSRSVLPKINQKELGAIMLPVCHYEEQLEIVSVIRSMLEKEQEARKLIEQSMMPLESTVSKVLETAFHGELGTNDPNEESPIGFLKKN